jgi:large-conductance mechanosensitive channel
MKLISQTEDFILLEKVLMLLSLMLSLEVNEIAIGYEALIEAMLDFVIIGFTILLVEKFMNSFRRKAQDPKDKTV